MDTADVTWLMACAAALAWGWLLALRGGFWRIDAVPAAPAPDRWPEVVAVIPARDEADVIGAAVRSLLGQDYPGKFSLVVTDDGSRDGTAELARQAAAAVGAADRLTVVTAPPLAAGWSGKMWAQAHGIAAAQSSHPEAELLLLTDADIGHAADALRTSVARLIAERRDMLSLMVSLSTATLAEKLIVPAFVFFFRLLYPFRWVADPARPTAAAAGGYILLRRDVLSRIGGLAVIRDALIDDCSLAAAVKGAGGRLSLDLAEGTVSLRRYPGASGLWMMIARSAYTQLDYSPWRLSGTVVAMCVGLLAPPLLVVFDSAARVPALAAWAAMSLAYAPMVRAYRLPLANAVLLPLVALFFLGATVDSARRHWVGRGGEWKGRVQMCPSPGGASGPLVPPGEGKIKPGEQEIP